MVGVENEWLVLKMSTSTRKWLGKSVLTGVGSPKWLRMSVVLSKMSAEGVITSQ